MRHFRRNTWRRERARSDELAPAPRLVDIRPGNRALTFNRRGTAVLVATLTSAREFPDGPGKRVTIPTDVWVTPCHRSAEYAVLTYRRVVPTHRCGWSSTWGYPRPDA